MGKRAAFPPLLLATLLGGCGGGLAPQGDPGARPDVLLLLIDTLRADHLGCYGYERSTSPTLDALAEGGALMSRASAQAPWTIPSVASMMTGRYLTAHTERPDPEATTLAEVFQVAGYHTLGVVANFVILNDVGFERGFDTFVTRHYEDERGRRRKRKDGAFDEVVGWARPHLERHAESEERPPLFFYLHVVDPHDSYERHPQYDDLLPLTGAPEVQPEGWWEDTLAAIGPPPPDGDPGWAKELDRMRRARTCYDREIRYSDDCLSSALEELEELGLRDNLLVAVVSDHGEELWEHLAPIPAEAQASTRPEKLFFQTHGYVLTEPSLRTPFLLSGPGISSGVVLDAPVENVDLFPTLLELCDLGIDFDIHGRSLVPWLRGEEPPDTLREATFAYVQHAMVVREEATNLKLVLPTEKGLDLGFGPSLHDLGDDPGERQDLFEKRPEDVARLTALLMDHLTTYPSTEQVIAGEKAQQLLEALEAFGYAGDMVQAGGGSEK